MSDVIEKKIVLRAPLARVWRAVVDQEEFGAWFGVRLEPGRFAAGHTVSGNITSRGYEHMTLSLDVVEVVEEERLSYRWRPYAIDPSADYSGEQKTLVTISLQAADGGTLLTIVESGFDQIPQYRRDEAWRMNDRGWSSQLKNIERHVSAE